MAQLPPPLMLQVKATIPQASGLETKPKKQGKFEWITKNFLFPFPFSAPLQITAVLPNNFLHKLKCWLCLQNFYLRKHAMTFYIITNLFHRKKREKKKKGEEAKQNPPPQHLQTSRSALICSEMGFPLKHILCGKPCFSFFFFFLDIWHQ